MSRKITCDDLAQSIWNNIARNVFGLSDKEIYGTDFSNSWINK